MKSIFMTGKGGVGKSTLSSAVAWQLSQRGHRVLGVSLDPAHNLGDIYGRKLGHKKKKFDENLFLAEIDLDKEAKRYVEQNMGMLTQVYSYTKAFNLDVYFKVLRHAPGVEEYAALTALEEILRAETEFDYIVFDTPPTALTLRILALPNITITWIDRLRRIRKDILKKRHTVHNLTGKYIDEGVILPYEEKDDPVMSKLGELFERYTRLYERLTSEDNHIAVVYNPDYLSFRETERIVEGLSDLDLPLRVAYNNKFTDEALTMADEIDKKLFGPAPDVKMLRIPMQSTGGYGAYRIDDDVIAPYL